MAEDKNTKKILEQVEREGRSISPNARVSSKKRLENFSSKIYTTQGTDLEKVLKQMEEKIQDPEKKKIFKRDMEGFKKLFSRFKAAKKGYLDWEKIKSPPADMVLKHKSLPDCPPNLYKQLASKLAVIKLNGGLGTSMGCVGPKSVIEVCDGMSFLDLTVHQIQFLNEQTGSDIPLVLLNSFNTDEDTDKIIIKYQGVIDVETFLQSRYPRILKETLLPMTNDPEGNIEHWYPPGHGDVYGSLVNSGLADKLLADGIEYVFISNIDNLGATVDFKILNWMVQNNIDFCMEVTDKTRSDVKGGTLIDYNGNAKLFEIAQCPPSKVDEFKSIKKFKIFNTNNLWVSLKSIKKFVEEGGPDHLDVIVNPKKALGKDVIQLETACGAAIEFFKNAKGVNVPRSRFLPVKSTSDLLLVQSNLYELHNGALIMNPKRAIPTVPLINLGQSFKKVSDFQERISTIPDILELDQLTVSGDVTFGSGVTLKGTVIIVANHGNRIDIPSGAYLENKVLSGNLRILDH